MTMCSFTKVFLLVAAPLAVTGMGTYAFLEYSESGWGNEIVPPLRDVAVSLDNASAPKKSAGGCCGSGGGCCCAAKRKACNCGGGGERVAANPSASAARTVGLLGTPLGPITAACALATKVTPPLATSESGGPATRPTPTP